MEPLVERSCERFASQLAAKTSVPGGGGASAYVGALAVSLCSMSANFTIGKKRFERYEEDIQQVLMEAERSRLHLLELVDEDASCFEPLSKAYAIPKDDPERSRIIEDATRSACKAPVAIMEECGRVIELLETMSTRSSKMLLSDIACGAYFAYAALQAAHINVLVNTKEFQDHDWAQETTTYCEGILTTYAKRADDCATYVRSIL